MPRESGTYNEGDRVKLFVVLGDAAENGELLRILGVVPNEATLDMLATELACLLYVRRWQVAPRRG